MTTRNCLDFLLTGYVCADLSGIIKVSNGTKASMLFPDIIENWNFEEDCEFFFFWTDNEKDLEKACEIAGTKTADYVLTCNIGFYCLFKIEN